MADTIETDPLVQQLRKMRLGGMASTVLARVAQADSGELTPLGLAQALADDEESHRDNSAITRRQKAAKFPEPLTIEDFDYDYSPERNKASGLIRELEMMRWLPEGKPILFYGPTGVAKTLLAQSLGQLAIRMGHDVRFTHALPILRYLDNGREKKGQWERRLNELIKPSVLILDSFGDKNLTQVQIEDLHEIITGRTGKPVIVTSRKNPKDWYGLFEVDKALGEAILDRLILTGYHVFLNGPSYRARQRPAHTTTHTTDQDTATTSARKAA
jgi:DNA replication protein DnaC